MVFPSRAVFVSSVAGSILLLVGFPKWAALTISFLGFLGMGGLQYCRLVYRTLPRDLKLLSKYAKVGKMIYPVMKNQLYISDMFQKIARKFPNRLAIVFEDKKITFKELDEMSNRVANLLRSTTNLQRGDTIAVFMENCPEYIVVYLGLSKIGVTAAFINHNLTGDSLAHCIRIANSSGVIFSTSLADAVSEVLPNLDHTVNEILYHIGEECSLSQAKDLMNESENASSDDPPPLSGKSINDITCKMYTSGTTGLPKACNIKQFKFIISMCGMGTVGNVTAEDRVFVVLPLYHASGMMIGVGQMFSSGATIVLKKKFSATNFFADCIKHKCTVFIYVGEVCRYLLAQPSRSTDIQHSIRVVIGNGLRAEIWTDFKKRFQIPTIAEFYGSTEGNIGFFNFSNKVGAVGSITRVLPIDNGIAIIKRDQETGEYLRDSNGFCMRAAINEPGEVVRKVNEKDPASIPATYDNATATNKKILKNVFTAGDKYYLSGDILRMDEDGFVYFCDRTGDTFRWKGENVSTTEVESVMARILQLRDVVVYGVEVPGSEGRAGMAAIAGAQDSIDLSGLAQQLFLSLPTYAVPLFIRLIPSVELTGSFKMKKVKLRNESFNVSLPDPIFMLDTSCKVYQPLTEEIYQQLQSGTKF